MPKKKNRSKLRCSDPVLISAQEFAKQAGLGAVLTRQLVASGQLPYREINGRRWILRSEALAVLRKQSKAKPAAKKVHDDAAEIRPEA